MSQGSRIFLSLLMFYLTYYVTYYIIFIRNVTSTGPLKNDAYRKRALEAERLVLKQCWTHKSVFAEGGNHLQGGIRVSVFRPLRADYSRK